MARTKTLYTVIVVLLAAMLVSSSFAAFYLFQYDQSQSNANTYLSELKAVQPTQTTNILLDFGNGTLLWHNDTQVQTGSNVYIATVLATHGVVNATWYGAPYNEHQVTGLDNVQNGPQQSWFIWTYNSTASWQVAQVGADDLLASNGSIFAWTFCNYNSTTYAPSCTP
jgi:hypothetical protein